MPLSLAAVCYMLTVTGGVGGLLGNAHILPGLLGCTLLGEAYPDTRHTKCVMGFSAAAGIAGEGSHH